MIPLELISPDAVIPTACKCLHFLVVDPKSNISFAPIGGLCKSIAPTKLPTPSAVASGTTYVYTIVLLPLPEE